MPFLAFFLSPVGRWLGIAAIAALAIGGIYMKGHSDGSDRVQRKWDAAVQAAVERGQKARDDAERGINSMPDDGGVRDPNNRD